MVDISTLNKVQGEAVEWDKGPALVLSGAGSGKTRVITFRTARLIEKGVDPSTILVTTFTKKAAMEMQERLAGLIGQQKADVVAMGTFHSIFFGVLREYWKATNNQLIRSRKISFKQTRWFVDEGRKITRMDPNVKLRDITLAISMLKNDLVRAGDPIPEKMASIFKNKKMDPEKVMIIYEIYEGKKFEHNIFDFDDMLIMTYYLIKDESNGWLRMLRDRWKFSMVDEFQDTNKAQMEILKLLFPPPVANLFVVGDDDQSIYGWRGAVPEFILDFAEKTYSGAKMFTMVTNYRSLEEITDHANLAIAHNEQRLVKELDSHRGKSGRGNTVTVMDSTDERDEAIRVTDHLRGLHEKQGMAWRDMACIYRTNAQSKYIEDQMIATGTPYRIIGGISFYGRQEVMDVLAYLKLAMDPTNMHAFTRAVNTPNRFLGRAFVNQFTGIYRTGNQVLDVLQTMDLKPYQRRSVNEFMDQMGAIVQFISENQKDVSAVLEFIVDTIEYREYLNKEVEDEDSAESDRMGNVQTLINSSAVHPDVHIFLEFVKEMTSKTTDTKDIPGDKVSLMTVHKAKGLEFPLVCVMGVSDGVMPHRKASDLEEERRLWYVAITRAMDHLLVTFSRRFNNKDVDPSQFIGEASMMIPGESKPKALAS